MKKVTVIGGGTGTFVVLSGIKHLEVDLAVIVNMMDSGGSTGKLRDQLEVLPPGDLRQCLVALSEASSFWRQLFLYRFEKGDLAGHNFGNIFLSALEKVCPNYDEVIETANYVLQTKGDVIPITLQKTHLVAEYESGQKLVGEGIIDENCEETTPITRTYLDPSVQPNPKAVERIMESDIVIIGPGDLYTSIIPIFLVEGMKEVFQKRNPQLIYNLNLMTKCGQTTDYKANDHIKDIEKFIGKTPDIVIVNNGEIDQKVLEWYEANHEHLVENDLLDTGYKGQIIIADVVDQANYIKNSSDILTRSILRHDSEKLAKVLQPFIE
jgi:uncharacterized cofD-like protein